MLPLFFFIFLVSSFSNNITLLGDASINDNGAISLTQDLGSSSIFSVGRAFYAYPIRFLDPISNTTSSFSTSFSFSIRPSPSFTFGDGLTFLITSNILSISTTAGFIGLPSIMNQESFIAVEFDTSFDPSLGDINDNHIGIDINSVVSFDSVDLGLMGFNLKSGRSMTAWIEYIDSEKTMKVWVDYYEGWQRRRKPPTPVLATHVDLSEKFKDFMHIGFSASNGRGAARHLVERWKFRAFGFNHSDDSTGDDDEENRCLMCSPDDDYKSSRTKRSSELVGLGLGGGAAIVLLILVIFLIGTSTYLVRKRRRISDRNNETLQICKAETRTLPKRFALSQLRSATRGFHRSKIIGEGASGTVYEGHLGSGRQLVAIKRFTNKTTTTTNPFITELTAMISTLKHKNILQLQGWCCESNELILVYEYLPLGSLDKVLHNPKSTIILLWEHRLNILIGIASALAYLHEECQKQIIHRDVKTCNIMLDDGLNAKLGDFSLAELCDHNNSRKHSTSSSIAVGTVGYLAPEYVHGGVATVKTDVYSYGVVVLEVVTGRRPTEGHSDGGMVLVDLVWEKWGEGRVMDVVDGRMVGVVGKGEVERVVSVGLSCVHPSCVERPVMKEVVRMLSGSGEVPAVPGRKPQVRLGERLPHGAQEVMLLQSLREVRDGISGGGHSSYGTPWTTPRTHF